MRNLIPWLIFGILAVLLAPRMWDEFQDRSHSSTWPMVEGTLVDGYIKEVVQNATSQQGYRPGHHYFVLVVESPTVLMAANIVVTAYGLQVSPTVPRRAPSRLSTP